MNEDQELAEDNEQDEDQEANSNSNARPQLATTRKHIHI